MIGQSYLYKTVFTLRASTSNLKPKKCLLNWVPGHRELVDPVCVALDRRALERLQLGGAPRHHVQVLEVAADGVVLQDEVVQLRGRLGVGYATHSELKETSGFKRFHNIAKIHVQGDHSGCPLGLDDMKTNVAFQHMLLILKSNF